MSDNLTKKQKQILDFLVSFVQDFGYMPTYREIAEAFDLSSPSSIHQYIKALEEKGYVTSSHNEARSIELTPKAMPAPESIFLPLMGVITAGSPIEAVEERETLAVPITLIDDPANSYVLRVKGESMIEDGILNGDYVIVERNPSPKNGDIVVALLDNAYATLKRFYREKDKIRLQPANSSMQPIFVRDPIIQGVVKGLIRTFSPNLSIR
jgi:repressor LexA